ncbi:MAG: hypothetical protein SFV19_01660 [Rhodospirillaceae bacterium]|nr:hypothetical protein [Rhodospirillaceae bacterium]
MAKRQLRKPKQGAPRTRMTLELSDEIYEEILANPAADLYSRQMGFKNMTEMGVSREIAISLFGKDTADKPLT